MDNGWIRFTNYRIPVDNLLDKISQITDDGVFTTTIPRPGKRFAIQLGTLSGGRVLSASNASDCSLGALSTAIRYSSCRKQFSRQKGGPEVCILDYPLHQSRLFPLFAKAFMTYVSVADLWSDWSAEAPNLADPNNKNVTYLHLLTSSMKPCSTWMSAECVRAARLACGGLGYSAYSNFHAMQQVSDINQTWEGENYVLIQQACKIILKTFTDLLQGKEPIKTLEFISVTPPEDTQFTGRFDDPTHLLRLLTYKTNKLIHSAVNKMQAETMKEDGERLSQVEIWEKHLNYSLIPVAKAYVDRYVLVSYIDFLENFEKGSNSHKVFLELCQLAVQNQVIEDAHIYKEILNDDQIEELKENCISLNKALRKDIVSLTYAIPLHQNQYGVIGKSTNNFYQNIMDSINKTPENTQRPDEWKYLYDNS